MTVPTLLMGNKNYSSWSVRPWFWLRHAGVPFTERVVPMGTPAFTAAVKASPTGRVPVLILDDGEVVWDSLAIGEAIAELWPEAGTWPEPPRLRRMGRSACAEMHSSFLDLRRVLTCNARRRYDPGLWRRIAGDSAPAVEADVRRVHALWASLLDASGGPYLVGAKPTYVDAFFAPVVSRFVTYGVTSPDDLVAYRDAVEALPAWGRWLSDAAREPDVIEKYEY